MAYFRGENYIWTDSSGFHFWAREGMDGWSNSGWSCDEDDQLRPSFEDASGVSVPEEIIDQFVMMRLAEILVDNTPEQVKKLIDDACEVGNFGSDCLKHNEQVLKEALLPLRLEKPKPD